MASAQVLQNSAASSSRKQGHLEAGKRRLEEFRKKKAEGKSKKAASTSQLLSPDVNNLDTSTSDGDNISRTESSSINTVLQSANSVSLNFDGATDIELKSKELLGNDEAEPRKDLDLSSVVDDYYTLRRDDSSLPTDNERGIKLSDGSYKRQQNASHSASSSSKFDDTSVFISHEDSSPSQQRWVDMNSGGKSDLRSQRNDVDSQRWNLPQSSSVDSASTLKSSSPQIPSSSSTSFPVASWRTRPSFHDFLNIPKPSSSNTTSTSTSHSLFSESAKADSAIPPKNSKFFSSEVHQLSSQKFADKSFQGIKDPYSSSSDSKRDGNLRNEIMDGDGRRLPDFPTSTKDEDFAALEQHIEDLTQDKFSLQRALESSRTLAESLASENSSLTENYNQQRKIVNELKSEMDRMQEEIRSHLIVAEAAKMESTSAQLECSAADERAKILASEVIGLEEKALRLRSNELKLEKQLENLNAEIGSYKRKLSSLEKERHDFQSTIEAMQEEKKLLLDKVRKTSSNDRVDTQKTSAPKKDSFTSTEDLVIETSNANDQGNFTGMASSPDVDSLSRNTSTFTPPEIGRSFIQDVPIMIPHDQQRMIDNISSLISELTLEREELVQVLRVKSSDYSKLMDANKELSQKLERQTQRLEFLTAQHMASESIAARPVQVQSMQETTGYTDEGDEVVERVLGWIMKMFPGGPSKRRTSKLL